MDFLLELTSTKSNYNEYRIALKNHDPPTIPFVGVALTGIYNYIYNHIYNYVYNYIYDLMYNDDDVFQ